MCVVVGRSDSSRGKLTRPLNVATAATHEDEVYMRIVRYYPRALVGGRRHDECSQELVASHGALRAEAVIAYDEGVSPPDEESVEWVQVRHAGRRGLKFPLGLEDVLKGTDLLVLHSGWTLSVSPASPTWASSGCWASIRRKSL